jgi:putative ABC transport system permease protein
MKPRDLLRLVWANLNRMRARVLMSGIGVLIGTAAIVILVSLAAGLQRSATESFREAGALNEITLLGGNVLRAFGGVGNVQEDTRLTPKVLRELAREPGVAAITPREQLAGGAWLQFNRLVSYTTITGIDPRIVRNLGWKTQSGRVRLGRWNVVIGARVADSFGGPRSTRNQAPLNLQGQTLRLTVSRTGLDGRPAERTIRVRVAGVLEERGGQDDYTVFLALEELEEINTWLLGQRPNRARDGYTQAVIVMESSEQVLTFQNELLTRGFFAFSASGTLQQINVFFVILQAIMGGVGGVALIVAAIGIANTLTMAILERTREIGLMKAVGATNRDVMSVFLAEAGGIGLFGGLGGVLVGWGVSALINFLARAYIESQAAAVGAGATGAATPADITYIPGWLPVLAVLFATAMGVLSGIYPAQRAVQLDPVRALKYE